MAEINLKFTSDQAEVIAGFRAIQDAASRTAITTKESTSANLRLYHEETRILDLKARGMHGLAADMEAENRLKREGLKLSKEFHLSEQAGLALARERLAVERQIVETKLSAPPINRVGLSSQGQRVRSVEEYTALMGGGSGTSTSSFRSKGGDATQAFYIAQDLAQGGLPAVLNQVPIALDLATRYTQKFTSAITGLGPVMGTVAVAALDAAAYVAGGKAVEWLSGNKGAPEGDAANEKWAAAQSGKIRAKQDEKAREKAREYAESRADLTRREGLGGQFSMEEAARMERIAALQERMKQFQMESLPLAEKLRAEASLQSQAEEEKNAREIKQAQDRVNLQRERLAESLKIIADMQAEMSAIKNAPPGTSGPGTGARYTYLKGAIEGERARADSLSNDPSNTRALRDAESRRDNELPKERELRSWAAESAIAENAKAIALQGDAALSDIQRSFTKFYDHIVSYAEEKTKGVLNARAGGDADLKVLDLRARGKNRQADKLEKENTISRDAQRLMDGPQKRSAEEARKIAEQRYDLTHRTPGRIRGAGYRIGDSPEAAQYGGLDALSRLNSRNRAVGAVDSTKPVYSGLDGLDALQQKNQRIRGAGFKGTQGGAAEATASAAANAAFGQGAGAALPMILGAIGSVRKELAALTSASRTIRR